MNMALEVEDLVAGYGKSIVLQRVSLKVREQEVVAVCGRNGAGKTTLLRTIGGMTHVRSGEVRIWGRAVTGARAATIARLGVAQVPEGRCLFPGLTVKENLLLGVFCEGRAGWRKAANSLDRVCSLFPWMPSRFQQAAGLLSGGEQQMVAIARGLMGNPRLLLLDEPSLGLAPAVIAEVVESLEDVKAQGVTLVLVEENMERVQGLVSHMYTMNAGVVAPEVEGDESRE